MILLNVSDVSVIKVKYFMTPERWQAVQQLIRDQYPIEEEYTEDLEPGSAHCLEFSVAQAQLKVCFIRRPKVLDKKTNYSHRAGGAVSVDYNFSDSEETSHLEVTRWNAETETWDPISGDHLF